MLKNVDKPIIIESLMLDQNIVKRKRYIFVGVLFVVVVVEKLGNYLKYSLHRKS